MVSTLPPEKTKWIVFHPEVKSKLERSFSGIDVLFISSEEVAAQIDLDQSHVVLVDFPTSKNLLVNLLSNQKIARIYAHFYKAESDYFSTIPTRDHFKWYYAFLLKRVLLILKNIGNALAKYRGWTEETIDFMSKVFFELGFCYNGQWTYFFK